MFSSSILDPEKFATELAAQGTTYKWIITDDPLDPTVFLYYPDATDSRPRCPYIPIKKSRIQLLAPIAQIPFCYGPQQPRRPIWVALVTLKPIDPTKDAELASAFDAIHALVNQTALGEPVGKACGCEGQSGQSSFFPDTS